MKGINYVLNDQNDKVAVMIDLKQHKDIWEDFYDYMIAESRKDEEKLSLDQVINDLKSEGKLDESI